MGNGYKRGRTPRITTIQLGTRSVNSSNLSGTEAVALAPGCMARLELAHLKDSEFFVSTKVATQLPCQELSPLLL